MHYLIVDMDGTLLNKEKKISKENIKWIQKWRERGKKIILASGRPFRLMKEYIRFLELVDEDIIICRDGQMIYKCSGELLWESKLLSGSDYNYIVGLLPKKNIEAFTEKVDYFYIPSRFRRYKAKVLMARKDRRICVINKINTNIEKIEKIKIASSDLESNILKKIQESYSVHKIMNTSYEINTFGVNKFTALCQAEQMGLIDLKKSVYLGDDYNDLECFEGIKFSVAMDNAVNDLKVKARYVTKSNDNDGVAYAIQQLLCKKRG